MATTASGIWCASLLRMLGVSVNCGFSGEKPD